MTIDPISLVLGSVADNSSATSGMIIDKKHSPEGQAVITSGLYSNMVNSQEAPKSKSHNHFIQLIRAPLDDLPTKTLSDLADQFQA